MTPYMETGLKRADNHDFANIERKHFQTRKKKSPICKEYLTDKKFVHRDLATRNILLSNERLLKISDFGLTRDVYETNMYRPTSSRKLPYKWMPLETIFDQIFTMKSDIWSFGIVLWEIVTLGGCPYPGIPNEDLFKLLKNGYRMEKPENCGQELYQMMLACWDTKPSNRPTFKQLRFDLEKLLEATQPYIDLNVMISEDYYKQDISSSRSNTMFDENPLSTVSAEDFTRVDWTKRRLIIPNYDCTDVMKPNSSLSDLISPDPIPLHQPTYERSKSSCELRIRKSKPTMKNESGSESKETLVNKENDSTLYFTNEILDVNGKKTFEHKNNEHYLKQEQSGEHSPNLSISDSGSDDSNVSLSKHNRSVFQTPSLTHGLLNQLSRVGRRRLGSSEYKHSFSLTEVSNLDKESEDLKKSSISTVI